MAITASTLRRIEAAQNALLAVALVTLGTLPPFLAFWPESIPGWATPALYGVSLAFATATMAIRPIADFAPGLRPYVTLRKGMGVLSASAVAVFLIAKLLADAPGYLASVATSGYWSWEGYAVLAHLGDLSALPLLATSNRFSRRAMGPWWKRVQKLAYVYFYAGAGYEAIALGSDIAALAIAGVTALVLGAWVKNGERAAAARAATA